MKSSTGRWVSGDDFFDREAGLRVLESHVADRNHLLLTGQIFSIFIITIAAAEVALGLAIVIAIYRSRSTVFVTDATQMRK